MDAGGAAADSLDGAVTVHVENETPAQIGPCEGAARQICASVTVLSGAHTVAFC